MTYLGILWRLWEKSLPKEKVEEIVKEVNKTLKEKVVNMKVLQRLIGQRNFASFVVLRGGLNHRHLIGSWIPYQNRHERHIHYPKMSQNWNGGWQYYHEAATDNITLSNTCSREEQTLHCNQKEMLVILPAFQSPAHSIQHNSFLGLCDNKTVVEYLKKEGGTKSMSLMEITLQILRLLDHYQTHLTIYHNPGKYNNQADHLSRHRRSPEWHMLPNGLQVVCSKWRVPTIDLFASETPHKASNYVSHLI